MLRSEVHTNTYSITQYLLKMYLKRSGLIFLQQKNSQKLRDFQMKFHNMWIFFIYYLSSWHLKKEENIFSWVLNSSSM